VGSSPAANACISLLFSFGPGSCRIFLLLCNGLLVSLLGKKTAFSAGGCQEPRPTPLGSLLGELLTGEGGGVGLSVAQQKGAAPCPPPPLAPSPSPSHFPLGRSTGQVLPGDLGLRMGERGEKRQFGLGALPGVTRVCVCPTLTPPKGPSVGGWGWVWDRAD